MQEDNIIYSPKKLASKFPTEIQEQVFLLLVQTSISMNLFATNTGTTPIQHHFEMVAESIDPDYHEYDEDYLELFRITNILNDTAYHEYDNYKKSDLTNTTESLNRHIQKLKGTGLSPALKALKIILNALEITKKQHHFELLDDMLSCAIDQEITENGCNHHHAHIIFTDDYTEHLDIFYSNFIQQKQSYENDVFTPFPAHNPQKVGTYIGASGAFLSALKKIDSL